MSDDDWNHRVLCPNGACNGLIGDEGTCKVCGHVMPNWGDERMRGLSADPVDATDELADDDDLADDDELADDGDDELEDDADDDVDDDGEAPAEWDQRTLCDDGACVGVIADNGLCTVCGKRSAA